MGTLTAPVLDASVVLAALLQEPGAETASAAMATGIISAVNVAEVMAGLLRDDVTEEDALEALNLLGDRVIAADHALAIDAGRLRRWTDVAGLSLGDRFCLALARRLNSDVITADRAWLRVADAIGVRITLLR